MVLLSISIGLQTRVVKMQTNNNLKEQKTEFESFNFWYNTDNDISIGQTCNNLLCIHIYVPTIVHEKVVVRGRHQVSPFALCLPVLRQGSYWSWRPKLTTLVSLTSEFPASICHLPPHSAVPYSFFLYMGAVDPLSSPCAHGAISLAHWAQLCPSPFKVCIQT